MPSVGNVVHAVKPPQWKVALWAKESVEPAMLRVPIIIITFIALWALNVWVLDRLRMPYGFVLNVKSISISYILGLCGTLITAYSLLMTLSTSVLGWSIETGILLFYCLVVFAHFLPSSFPGSENQYSFYRLLKLVVFPMHVVTFPEVLLADALCSVSKLLKDLGTTSIAVYAYFRREDIILYHDSGMILVALLASIPFWIRVRQCSIQLDSCPDAIAKLPVWLNIMKYLSSFPPIWLTAFASLGYQHPRLPQLITAAAVVNSVFSFLWDTIMDWGLLTFTRNGRVLRRQRTFYPVFVYVIAVVINLILRFSWTINRWPGCQQLHSSIIVLVIELGEVIRRALWNCFRIEWEVLVQQEKINAAKDGGDVVNNNISNNNLSALLNSNTKHGASHANISSLIDR